MTVSNDMDQEILTEEETMPTNRADLSPDGAYDNQAYETHNGGVDVVHDDSDNDNGDYEASEEPQTFTISRDVYTQQDFDLDYEARTRPSKTIKDRAKNVKSSCKCNGTRCYKFIKKLFPFITIMKSYNIKNDLINDLISGATVGIMQIPQAMAYSMLANLPPVFGLYTSIFPIVVYFFFGTSRQISLGTLAVVSLLVGNAVQNAGCDERYPGPTSSPEPDYNFTTTVSWLDENTTTVENDTTEVISISSRSRFTENELCKVGTATSVTLLAALILIAMGILRLGFVTIYLSEPITRGFMTGSAFHVFSSQLKNWFGIKIGSYSGPLKLIYMYRDWVLHIPKINWCAFLICIIAMVVLYITKEYINPKVKAKIKMPIPIELIVVILATVAVHFGKFNEKYKVTIVGEIPTGIPAPSVPPLENAGGIIAQSFVLAIVTFAIAISMSYIFAKKHGYQVDANQELLALGISNTVASFFHSFMGGASLSRSSVQDGAGGVTQLAGVISAGLLLLVLFFIAPLFESLPNACLAAVIVVALKSLFEQFKDLPMLWKTDKIDFATWMVACWATFLLDIEYGLGCAIGFGLLTVIFRNQRPYTCTLGRVPNTDIYKNISVYKKAEEIPGIKIFRLEASLFYANKHNAISKLYAKSGVNPRKLKLTMDKVEKRKAAALKKEEKNNAKKLKQQEKDGQANGEIKVDINPEFSIAKSIEVTKPDLKYIIIDCSMMGFVDYDGAATLTQIIGEYREVGIAVYLAGPKAGVRAMLERAGFYKKADRGCVFVSIHDAVLTCQEELHGTSHKLNHAESKMSCVSESPTIATQL